MKKLIILFLITTSLFAQTPSLWKVVGNVLKPTNTAWSVSIPVSSANGVFGTGITSGLPLKVTNKAGTTEASIDSLGNATVNGLTWESVPALNADFIPDINNPISRLSLAGENSTIMDGTTADTWFSQGLKIYHTSATNSLLNNWAIVDTNVIVSGKQLTGGFVYAAKSGSTYYLFLVQGANVSAGDGDLFMYTSSDKVNFTIANSGNPVLTHGSGTATKIFNCAVAFVGTTMHLLAELQNPTYGKFAIYYSHTNLSNPNFNTNLSDIIFPTPADYALGHIAGNPELKYLPDRGALLALYGYTGTDGVVLYTKAGYISTSADPSVRANWSLAPSFPGTNFTNPTISIADPNLVEVNNGTVGLLITESYNQNSTYQYYNSLTLDQFYDVIIAPSAQTNLITSGQTRLGNTNIRGLLTIDGLTGGYVPYMTSTSIKNTDLLYNDTTLMVYSDQAVFKGTGRSSVLKIRQNSYPESTTGTAFIEHDNSGNVSIGATRNLANNGLLKLFAQGSLYMTLGDNVITTPDTLKPTYLKAGASTTTSLSIAGASLGGNVLAVKGSTLITGDLNLGVSNVADANLRSDDSFWVHVDNGNAHSNRVFGVQKANTVLFQVKEDGSVTLGSAIGTGVYPIYAGSYYTGTTIGYLTSALGSISATIGTVGATAVYTRAITINGVTINVVTSD